MALRLVGSIALSLTVAGSAFAQRHGHQPSNDGLQLLSPSSSARHAVEDMLAHAAKPRFTAPPYASQDWRGGRRHDRRDVCNAGFFERFSLVSLDTNFALHGADLFPQLPNPVGVYLPGICSSHGLVLRVFSRASFEDEPRRRRIPWVSDSWGG